MILYLLDSSELLQGTVIHYGPLFTPDGYPVYSRQLVCPVCCRIWAKITVEGDPWYRPEAAPCCFCPQTFDDEVPGSVLPYSISVAGIDLGLIDHLPEDWLRRELLLTLKALSSNATVNVSA